MSHDEFEHFNQYESYSIVLCSNIGWTRHVHVEQHLRVRFALEAVACCMCVRAHAHLWVNAHRRHTAAA